ncbi:serine/threonine-protein kinase [Aneurinibacillus uraniidurans]|uniref:serine/threonine-protein kinase n=1 Tax=Aneurinibacillus uraniidurans TaxID=2966586 RepID=UPI002349141F|nr:serine/threonine-protein kinase [Aneurinibacillus sp. B1]WCN36220.1 AAA domain-containing protein [Aneurinibacillus sp. B1]
MIGNIIANKYHLLNEINEGETSYVYMAKNIKTKEAVAVKLLNLRVNSKEAEEIQEIFRRESEALSLLNHENIIEYLDSGIEDDFFYIVTKYVEGYNLKDYIAQKELNLEEKLQIILKILDGIAEAHNKNILHRDLKPTNILVSDTENVKIIDFGISKILGINNRGNKTLKDYMTVAYSSPEQLSRGKLDIKSDLYSVGGILYYLLTHQNPPEDKDKITDSINNIVCSDSLKKILFKALHKNAEERYITAYQFIKDIKQEYIYMYSKSKTFYVKFSDSISNHLFEVGKIGYKNKANVQTFISNNLKQSSIYKGNRFYYLIGERLKYRCYLSEDSSHLIIDKVFVLDSYTEQEREFNKGITLDIEWTVIDFSKKPTKTPHLKELLQQVIVAKEKLDAKKSREKKSNELIKKWDRYLSEEDQINYRKANLGYYSHFSYDWESGKLFVDTDKINYSLANGDPIQLTDQKGTQVTVGVYDGIENDQLSIILNNNIDVDTLSTRGKIGLDIIQSASVVKRLRRAIRTLNLNSSTNKQLLHLLANPQHITMKKPKMIKDFCYPNLDDSNKEAVRRALATDDIFLIQGPPGTGKTTVITEIVCQIFKEDPQAKVLLSSQSHVAVDHAIQGIAQYLEDKKIIRVGRSERISEYSETLLIKNQLSKWIEEVKNSSKNGVIDYFRKNYRLNSDEEQDILNQLVNLGAEYTSTTETTHSPLDYRSNEIKRKFTLIKEWHRRLTALDEFDEIFAQKASIVAATCTGIASRHLLNDMTFDWVIIDEAARATAPELLVPMIRGKKVILVGDHQQLPPIIGRDREKIKSLEIGIKSSDLEKSLFEELFDKIAPEAKIVLTAQFRMHPTISKMINKIFYPTTNIITKKTAEERAHLLDWHPKSIIWLNTERLKNNSQQELFNSFRNNVEAQIILRQLETIERKYAGVSSKIKVGVISGYDLQKKLLINLIKPNDSKWKNLKIFVDNVDAFQGSETDIAIYSLVRCNPENRIGFLSDERRLNVALSRGKTCLIIVGNARFARKASSHKGNPFADVLRFIERYPDECVMEELM